ncbi:MAG: hypothetical protein AAGU21_00305 [Solidesulfovibrio sp.]|uniref:hypothetical protein n=1 Tax=Solidesulfovibrio sp. TaxID=2910990 RepID=UPI00315881A7
MAKKLKATLIYPLGQRDVQCLRPGPHGNFIHAPFGKEDLGQVCEIMQSLINEGMQPNMTSLVTNSPHVGALERDSTPEKNPEDVFNQDSQAFLCFPIFERVLETIGRDASLTRIVCVNTNRQGATGAAGSYAKREPHCFDRFFAMFVDWLDATERLGGAKPQVDHLTITSNHKELDEGDCFQQAAAWFWDNAETLDQTERVYYMTGPGIPKLSNSLRHLLGVHLPPRKLVVLKKDEKNHEIAPDQTTLFETYYRNRHSLLFMLRAGAFDQAWRCAKEDRCLKGQRDIRDLCRYAAHALGLREDSEDDVAELERRYEHDTAAAEWIRLARRQSPLHRMLTRALHAKVRHDYNLAGLLAASTLELTFKAALENKWPGTVAEKHGNEYFRIDRLDAPIQKRLVENRNQWRRDETYYFLNFKLYEALAPDLGDDKLPRLITATEDLRCQRNRFLHSGCLINRDSVVPMFDENNPDSLISVAKGYAASKDGAYVYWPKLAAQDLVIRLQRIPLGDIFAEN